MLSDFTPIVHKLDGRTIRVWAVADVMPNGKLAVVVDTSEIH